MGGTFASTLFVGMRAHAEGVRVDMEGAAQVQRSGFGSTEQKCYDPYEGWILVVYDKHHQVFRKVGECDDNHPPLIKMVDVIGQELYGARACDMSLRDLLHRACVELGVVGGGRSLLQQARACYDLLRSPRSDRMPTTSMSLDEQPTVPALNLSSSQPAELGEDCAGPSITERSERRPSDRESPPRIIVRGEDSYIDLRKRLHSIQARSKAATSCPERLTLKLKTGAARRAVVRPVELGILTQQIC